jgi:hypothetical protein
MVNQRAKILLVLSLLSMCSISLAGQVVIKNTPAVDPIGYGAIANGSGSEDVMLYQVAPDTSQRTWPAASQMEIHNFLWDQYPVDYVSLIRFNIAANPIPAGMCINSATLRLYYEWTDYGPDNYNQPAQMNVYQCLGSWDVGTATWNSICTGLAWQVGGARGTLDRNEVLSSKQFTDNRDTPNYGWVEFDVTPAVMDWYSGATNNGFVLDYNAYGNVRIFVATLANGMYGGVENRPELVIHYGPATPTFSPAYSIISGLKTITISCSTPGATIYYTTDGTEPTTTNGTAITSGESVLINVNNTTLKACSWNGTDLSTVKSVTYAIPAAYSRPSAIAKNDSIAVDGNLAEWRECDFIPLDKNYDGAGAPDVMQASYAAKWSLTGKIYVAVKVLDTAHVFTENYGVWDSRDAIELYLHTQGTIGGYSGKLEIAQQYAVGIKLGTTDQVWSSLADTKSVPESANFAAAGKVVGDWIYYECQLTAFDYFGGYLGKSSVASTLSENDVIGLDICVVGNNGSYSGMKAENTQIHKSNDYTQFGLHRLVNDDPFLVGQWGPVAPNGGGNAYYLNDNVFNGYALGSTLGNGIWELDKTGSVVASLVNTNTAKSVAKVGNWLYYTYSIGSGTDYVYRAPADTWAAPGVAVTVSDNQPLVSLASDGTYLYGSTAKNSGANQVSKYAIDSETGNLTLVWTTAGIEATGVRGLSYYDGATEYIYAVSGGRNSASGTANVAHIYAIRTDTGAVTDLGAIEHFGETYQIARVGKQLWVAATLSGSSNDGKIYVFNLTDDITLASTAPTTVCNPEGIVQIFGLAVDRDFVWLAGQYGQVFGYKFYKPRLAGDANEDEMVDVGDLGILAANYGGSGKTWNQGDFNNDGLVDVGDLGILAAHYGEGANATMSFEADYAKVFGTIEDESDSANGTTSTVCSGLGLPLVAGLMLVGLCLLGGMKWKE